MHGDYNELIALIYYLLCIGKFIYLLIAKMIKSFKHL